MIIYEQIKALLAKMENLIQPTTTGPVRQPTQQKRARKVSPHNHNRGESKARRVMAAKSNRVNRQRVKHWKH